MESSEVRIQVLIIEDDARIAEINSRFVEKVSGYQVIGVAQNGQQAEELLAILQPDLVLLDVYFPDTNGLDLLKYMKQYHPQVDVIMITAATEVQSVEKALHIGIYDYIVKPVIFERFQETLLNYRTFQCNLGKLLSEHTQVKQEDIDRIMQNRDSSSLSRVGKGSSHFPKGIDKLTLERITKVIDATDGGLTAEQVGQQIGCSRTTARRYLEFLVARGEATANLSYGVVGRPERVYQCVRGMR